jgi:hypothetical protein
MCAWWAGLLLFLLGSGCISTATAAPPVTHTIRVDTGQVLNKFRPLTALGAGIDRLSTDAIDKLYQPSFLKQVLTAGWGAVSYRLNTELHIEAWHWNPRGQWSDAPGQRGYFTGDAHAGEPIRDSFGYTLPRRGFTRNEGTEENGFSRLTDGDARSFWKSNPYLSKEYTGEDDALYPQFVVIDLERYEEVDTLQIDWAPGYPYAHKYSVDYFVGEDAMKKPSQGKWVPLFTVDDGKGGRDVRRLAPRPQKLRHLRITLLESSRSCEAALAADRRNCLGFAIAELHLARGDKDVLRHSADQQQSATFCSSVDPWHEEGNIARHGEQTGFDRFYQSGVTRGLPAMIPVSLLYGIPEDSANQIAWLKQRGYPISYVELGEEPDGQYMMPEHYAQLYLQWASALHAVDPALKLGGPVFTGQNEDIRFWPDAQGDASWLGRFVKYLKTHGRMSDLAFVSFEHYPYDPCKVSWKDLYDEPRLIRHVVDVYRADGVPREVPLLVTEVNIAWQSSQTFVDSFGALWLADYVGAFFSAGGAGSYYFHYLPWPLDQQCAKTWGTFGMFKSNDDDAIEQPTSQYHATRLLTQTWVVPGNEEHEVYAAASDDLDEQGRPVVSAYALHRPDGRWSLLLVNKDAEQAHTLRVRFGERQSFAGPVSFTVFGRAQYVWHADGPNGHADPDEPPATSSVPGGPLATYTLPPASVAVLAGRIR